MHEGQGGEVEAMLGTGKISRPAAMVMLEEHYMLCDRIPMAEFETGKPQEVLAFFMLESRTSSWHRRHMRPLGHLDLVVIDENVYAVMDTALAASKGIAGDFKMAGGIFIGVKII